MLVRREIGHTEAHVLGRAKAIWTDDHLVRTAVKLHGRDR
jgi:hypothetical protein